MTKAGIVGVVLAFGAGYLVAVEIFRKGLRMGARLARADMRCSKCGNEDARYFSTAGVWDVSLEGRWGVCRAL